MELTKRYRNLKHLSKYQCPYCLDVHFEFQWNSYTREKGKYDFITTVSDAMKNPDKDTRSHFYCPNCDRIAYSKGKHSFKIIIPIN